MNQFRQTLKDRLLEMPASLEEQKKIIRYVDWSFLQIRNEKFLDFLDICLFWSRIRMRAGIVYRQITIGCKDSCGTRKKSTSKVCTF